MNILKTITEDLRADSNDEPNPVVSAQQQSERMNAILNWPDPRSITIKMFAHYIIHINVLCFCTLCTCYAT